jgi:hypothetical protein
MGDHAFLLLMQGIPAPCQQHCHAVLCCLWNGMPVARKSQMLHVGIFDAWFLPADMVKTCQYNFVHGSGTGTFLELTNKAAYAWSIPLKPQHSGCNSLQAAILCAMAPSSSYH